MLLPVKFFCTFDELFQFSINKKYPYEKDFNARTFTDVHFMFLLF